MNYPSNLLSRLKPVFRSQLEKLYDHKEAENLVNLLINHYLGLTRTDQALNSGLRLSESELLNFHFAVKRLLNSEPIQYVLGETEFYGLKLEVNPNVLIPRPETEELAKMIISKGFENKRILDIGTGSGSIAIALQKNLKKCRITGLDISEKALQTAKKNALINEVNVEFIKADIRNSEELIHLGVFDIIVSNPPYVTHQDKKLMNRNVLDWEPLNALFAPEDNPLFFYNKILKFSNKHLSDNGQIFLEINENYGQELITRIKAHSFSQIILYQDFRGKDRFISAFRKSSLQPDPTLH